MGFQQSHHPVCGMERHSSFRLRPTGCARFICVHLWQICLFVVPLSSDYLCSSVADLSFRRSLVICGQASERAVAGPKHDKLELASSGGLDASVAA
jgi:hypothetical protein